MTRLEVDLDNPNGHVTQYSFGRNGRPSGGEIERLFAEMDAVRPATAEMLLREAYLVDFDIRPVTHQAHPLDLVRLYPKEDVVEGGAVRSMMRKYLRYGIKEQWGISYNEFMELPYDEAAFMLEVSETDALRKVSEQGRTKRDMERDLASMQRTAR